MRTSVRRLLLIGICADPGKGYVTSWLTRVCDFSDLSSNSINELQTVLDDAFNKIIISVVREVNAGIAAKDVGDKTGVWKDEILKKYYDNYDNNMTPEEKAEFEKLVESRIGK